MSAITTKPLLPIPNTTQYIQHTQHTQITQQQQPPPNTNLIYGNNFIHTTNHMYSNPTILPPTHTHTNANNTFITQQMPKPSQIQPPPSIHPSIQASVLQQQLQHTSKQQQNNNNNNNNNNTIINSNHQNTQIDIKYVQLQKAMDEKYSKAIQPKIQMISKNQNALIEIEFINKSMLEFQSYLNFLGL